jgi:hypothetical protein
MQARKPLIRRLRAMLTDNVYVADSRVFFHSSRGFRLVAKPLGIRNADGLKPDERVSVAVTPGWWLLSFFRKPPGVEAIVARFPFGRFGNQTFQLVHTLTIARHLGLPRALLPGNTVTPSGVRQLRDDVLWDNRQQCVAALTLSNLTTLLKGLFSARAHLSGTFFHTAVLPAGIVTAWTRSQTFEALREALEAKTDQPATGPDHLVIHIRGDDVFNTLPPKAFAQPPLAFYQMVLDDYAWKEVTVVSGDLLNPVIEPLFAELDSRGVAHRFQSGSLEEDMAHLSGAHTVVAGRGTFVPAITGLSPNTAKVYCFEDDHLFRTDIDLRIVIDNKGDYVESTYRNNWRNTPSQRELMLKYESENLTFRS